MFVTLSRKRDPPSYPIQLKDLKFKIAYKILTFIQTFKL